MPVAGGQSEEALGDSGEDTSDGASAVGFGVELAFEGLVDRFDPLADAAKVAVAVGLVAAVGA